jgi:hypothetical protein
MVTTVLLCQSPGWRAGRDAAWAVWQTTKPAIAVNAQMYLFNAKSPNPRFMIFGIEDIRKTQASGSFLKKRTKKLLLLRDVALTAPRPTGIKVFLLLFVHKK